jgi:hypothetical protein
MTGSSGAVSCFMAFEVSLSNSLPADDSDAVTLAAGVLQRASASSVLTGLTSGVAEFKAKYRRQGGGSTANCAFVNRSIMVIPLP